MNWILWNDILSYYVIVFIGMLISYMIYDWIFDVLIMIYLNIFCNIMIVCVMCVYWLQYVNDLYVNLIIDCDYWLYIN